MIKYLFLIISLFIDLFINFFVNSNYAGTGNSLTPNFLFVSLMIISFDKSFSRGFILSFLVGLLFDFVNIDSLFSYSFIFLFCYLIMKAWKSIINESFFELLLMNIALVFVKELIIYILYVRNNFISFSLTSWAEKHLFLTIITAIIAIVIILFIKDQMNALQDRLKYSLKKDERLSFRNY